MARLEKKLQPICSMKHLKKIVALIAILEKRLVLRHTLTYCRSLTQDLPWFDQKYQRS